MGGAARVSEIAAARAVGELLHAVVRREPVLELQLPGPGAVGVATPEAAVGHAQGRVLPALGVHAGGPVPQRQVGPVVVLSARRRGQVLPPLHRVLPLGLEERPERGGVDHHAVVQVRGIAGVLLAVRASSVRRRGAPVGALLDGGGEGVELVPGLQRPVVAPLGGPRRLRVGAVLGNPQGELPVGPQAERPKPSVHLARGLPGEQALARPATLDGWLARYGRICLPGCATWRLAGRRPHPPQAGSHAQQGGLLRPSVDSPDAPLLHQSPAAPVGRGRRSGPQTRDEAPLG